MCTLPTSVPSCTQMRCSWYFIVPLSKSLKLEPLGLEPLLSSCLLLLLLCAVTLLAHHLFVVVRIRFAMSTLAKIAGILSVDANRRADHCIEAVLAISKSIAGISAHLFDGCANYHVATLIEDAVLKHFWFGGMGNS